MADNHLADQRCAICARGYSTGHETVACGAAVDDAALLGLGGSNPIWAERKYSPGRLSGLAFSIGRAQLNMAPNTESDARLFAEPGGSDPENMDPNDGADCKMFKKGE